MLVPGGTMSFVGGHGGGNENSSSSREWHRSRGHSRLVVTVEVRKSIYSPRHERRTEHELINHMRWVGASQIITHSSIPRDTI